jgi:uncharacterized protein YjbI with pentapeptide repeats
MFKLSLTAFIILASTGVQAFAPISKTSVAETTRLYANKEVEGKSIATFLGTAALSFTLLFGAGPALADGQTKNFKLPPIDFNDQTRCEFTSSKMGQANAQRDKLYDLRQCKLTGKDASGFDLSGVIMKGTDVSNTKFVESQFSKAYLHDSNFDGADFTNGIVDRASFEG